MGSAVFGQIYSLLLRETFHLNQTMRSDFGHMTSFYVSMSY